MRSDQCVDSYSHCVGIQAASQAFFMLVSATNQLIDTVDMHHAEDRVSSHRLILNFESVIVSDAACVCWVVYLFCCCCCCCRRFGLTEIT